MAKRLQDTQFASSINVDRQMDGVIKFLIENRNIVLSPDIVARATLVKPVIPTIINTLFEHLVTKQGLNLFATVYPAKTTFSVPDLIAMPQITIDLASYSHAHALDSFSELKEKILVNIGHLIRTKGTDMYNYQISDINQFHNLYVRGALCRSFYKSEGWLTPSLCLTIIKTYALTLSNIVQQQYSLNYNDQLTAAAMFALYMSQMLAHPREDMVKPRLFNMCNFIGNQGELDNIAMKVSDVSKDGLNMVTTCELIARLCPGRVEGFHSGILFRRASNLGSDELSSMVAMDYPPYWVHQLLLSVSGSKVPLIFHLKGHKLVQEVQTFAHELNISPMFINHLVGR